MMKKTILLMTFISLLMVSCKDDKKDEPNAPVKLSDIVKDFKFIEGVSTENISKKAMPDLNKWIEELNIISKNTNEAKKGKAGKLGKRYVNTRGVETEQLIKKGLIGALQLNNFNLAYMGAVMGKDANERKEAVDKAVKYLLGSTEPKTKDEFKEEGNAFGKYMMSTAKSDKYKDIDKDIYKLIQTAYDNASNFDSPKYTQAFSELNKKVTTVVAFRAVHYMAKYTEKIRKEFKGGNVHELSEGLGFAYSLRFAYKGNHMYYLTPEQAMEFANVNLWDEAKDKSGNSFLDKQAEAIAEMFGFTVEDAK